MGARVTPLPSPSSTPSVFMSRVLAYLAEAGASLWRNRTRSILTMLGMIIGSASIITVFGLSKAATSGIEGTFKSFGTFPIVVQVDRVADVSGARAATIQ